MERRTKIGLKGHLAKGEPLYDGQTVSTRLWKRQLEKMNIDVYLVDTYKYKKNALKIMWSWIRCMFCCENIIIMLSANGLTVFLPLLYYSNKVFKRKIYHRVIGGSIDKYVQNKPKSITYLNSFSTNWVQSPALVKKLNSLGVNNAEYLENFRDVAPIDSVQLYQKQNYVFCTFCRVSAAKGITLAIESISKVNEKYGKIVAELHVYGPVENEYKMEFENLCEKYRDFVKYMGSVPSENAVNVLKDYFMHLFPTTWSGEGFPGTIIDCYNAGLPTIASSWAYNSEFIENGKTGYIYDWKQPDQLADLIDYSINNSQNNFEMRQNNLCEAYKYSADVIMNRVLKKILE